RRRPSQLAPDGTVAPLTHSREACERLHPVESVPLEESLYVVEDRPIPVTEDGVAQQINKPLLVRRQRLEKVGRGHTSLRANGGHASQLAFIQLEPPTPCRCRWQS